MNNLNPQQFSQHTYIDSQGEYSIPSDRRFGKVPVERVREGDLMRYNSNLPFMRAHGPATHDPSHPSDTSRDPDEDFPTRMYIVPTERGFTPHKADGTPFEVYR